MLHELVCREGLRLFEKGSDGGGSSREADGKERDAREEDKEEASQKESHNRFPPAVAFLFLHADEVGLGQQHGPFPSPETYSGILPHASLLDAVFQAHIGESVESWPGTYSGQGRDLGRMPEDAAMTLFLLFRLQALRRAPVADAPLMRKRCFRHSLPAGQDVPADGKRALPACPMGCGSLPSVSAHMHEEGKRGSFGIEGWAFWPVPLQAETTRRFLSAAIAASETPQAWK